MLTATYVLGLLQDIAKKHSGDRKTQVGAGFYHQGQLIWGVNHLAYDLPEEDICNRTTLFYATMVHAEADLVANYKDLMKGATVYVTLFPCDKCAEKLISADVAKIVVLEDRPTASYIIKAKELLDKAGIPYEIVE